MDETFKITVNQDGRTKHKCTMNVHSYDTLTKELPENNSTLKYLGIPPKLLQQICDELNLNCLIHDAPFRLQADFENERLIRIDTPKHAPTRITEATLLTARIPLNLLTNKLQDAIANLLTAGLEGTLSQSNEDSNLLQLTNLSEMDKQFLERLTQEQSLPKPSLKQYIKEGSYYIYSYDPRNMPLKLIKRLFNYDDTWTILERTEDAILLRKKFSEELCVPADAAYGSN